MIQVALPKVFDFFADIRNPARINPPKTRETLLVEPAEEWADHRSAGNGPSPGRD